MPGSKSKRLGVGTTAPGGPVTKEPGYWAYFELCRWDTKIDPAIQSAYVTSGDKWGPFNGLECNFLT